MFTLLSINNQHITCDGLTTTNNQWAELFFASFYAFGVLMLLNIVTAIFLTQFTEYITYVQNNERQREREASLVLDTNSDNDVINSKLNENEDKFFG